MLVTTFLKKHICSCFFLYKNVKTYIKGDLFDFLLKVVSFLHTILLCDKMDFRTALVVCPLNTALNWLNEFEKWQEGLEDDEKLEVCIIHNGLQGTFSFNHEKLHN